MDFQDLIDYHQVDQKDRVVLMIQQELSTYFPRRNLSSMDMDVLPDREFFFKKDLCEVWRRKMW